MNTRQRETAMKSESFCFADSEWTWKQGRGVSVGRRMEIHGSQGKAHEVTRISSLEF